MDIFLEMYNLPNETWRENLNRSFTKGIESIIKVLLINKEQNGFTCEFTKYSKFNTYPQIIIKIEEEETLPNSF